MSNDILLRIKDLIAKFGPTQTVFSAKTGIRQSNLSKILSGERPCGQAIINKLVVSLGVNKDWLLTGEGEMLKQEDINIIQPEDGEDKGLIPFYDAETTGGASGYVSSSMEDVSLVGYIKPGSWFGGKITAAIRHVGDSMTEYPDGCILAVREVTDRRLLIPGRNYVIETTEFRVTKRLQKGSSPRTVTLYSTNQERYADGRLIHEPFEVAFEDIRRIFTVIGYIVNQAGDCQILQIG